MNTPKIRLEGFKEDWDKKEIGTLGTTYSGLTGKSKSDFGQGDAQYITFLNVLTNAHIDTSAFDRVDVKLGERQNAVHKGDILFNTSSETPDEVGLCSVLMEDINNLYLNSFCFGFRPHDNAINAEFLVYLMRSQYGRSITKILAQGATRYNLSKKRFCEAVINVPASLNEQKQIADYLTHLDSLIEATTKKINSLKQTKQACLQSMFPQSGENKPRVRFKGFEGDWIESTFGDLLSFERPDNYIVKSTVYSNDYPTPVLTANKGFILGYTNETNTYNDECILFDDFTLDCKHVSFPFMVKSSALKILTSRDENKANLYFVYSLLKLSNIEILGHARHYISVVQPTKILIPSNIMEQEKIAAFFSNLDKQIALYEERVEKLKNVKIACLDSMFV